MADIGNYDHIRFLQNATDDNVEGDSQLSADVAGQETASTDVFAISTDESVIFYSNKNSIFLNRVTFAVTPNGNEKLSDGSGTSTDLAVRPEDIGTAWANNKKADGKYDDEFAKRIADVCDLLTTKKAELRDLQTDVNPAVRERLIEIIALCNRYLVQAKTIGDRDNSTTATSLVSLTDANWQIVIASSKTQVAESTAPETTAKPSTSTATSTASSTASVVATVDWSTRQSIQTGLNAKLAWLQDHRTSLPTGYRDQPFNKRTGFPTTKLNFVPGLFGMTVHDGSNGKGHGKFVVVEFPQDYAAKNNLPAKMHLIVGDKKNPATESLKTYDKFLDELISIANAPALKQAAAIAATASSDADYGNSIDTSLAEGVLSTSSRTDSSTNGDMVIEAVPNPAPTTRPAPAASPTKNDIPSDDIPTDHIPGPTIPVYTGTGTTDEGIVENLAQGAVRSTPGQTGSNQPAPNSTTDLPASSSNTSFSPATAPDTMAVRGDPQTPPVDAPSGQTLDLRQGEAENSNDTQETFEPIGGNLGTREEPLDPAPAGEQALAPSATSLKNLKISAAISSANPNSYHIEVDHIDVKNSIGDIDSKVTKLPGTTNLLDYMIPFSVTANIGGGNGSFDIIFSDNAPTVGMEVTITLKPTSQADPSQNIVITFVPPNMASAPAIEGIDPKMVTELQSQLDTYNGFLKNNPGIAAEIYDGENQPLQILCPELSTKGKDAPLLDQDGNALDYTPTASRLAKMNSDFAEEIAKAGKEAKKDENAPEGNPPRTETQPAPSEAPVTIDTARVKVLQTALTEYNQLLTDHQDIANANYDGISQILCPDLEKSGDAAKLLNQDSVEIPNTTAKNLPEMVADFKSHLSTEPLTTSPAEEVTVSGSENTIKTGAAKSEDDDVTGGASPSTAQGAEPSTAPVAQPTTAPVEEEAPAEEVNVPGPTPAQQQVTEINKLLLPAGNRTAPKELQAIDDLMKKTFGVEFNTIMIGDDNNTIMVQDGDGPVALMYKPLIGKPKPYTVSDLDEIQSKINKAMKGHVAAASPEQANEESSDEGDSVESDEIEQTGRGSGPLDLDLDDTEESEKTTAADKTPVSKPVVSPTDSAFLLAANQLLAQNGAVMAETELVDNVLVYSVEFDVNGVIKPTKADLIEDGKTPVAQNSFSVLMDTATNKAFTAESFFKYVQQQQAAAAQQLKKSQTEDEKKK